MLRETKGHAVACYSPNELNEENHIACISIIRTGGAVDDRSAARELRLATVLAVARSDGEIVGVGAIKRARPAYAAKIARSSRVSMSSDMNELGYVAVDHKHKRRGIASRIVSALLSRHGGAVFATTDSVAMKGILQSLGFRMKGKEWKGNRGQLSLWIRE